MKIRIFLPLLVIFSLILPAQAQYTDADLYQYIETYKELAIEKMAQYKIPASITLAQGIFESACGKSKLATEGNNHFGIKCHKDWTGDTIKIDDDELQECFRKYEKVEESYNDHSRFLTSRQRYKALFSLDVMDYKAWAKGLKAAGYATNPQYAERLINLIERFNLAQQDTICMQRIDPNFAAEKGVEEPQVAENQEVTEEQEQKASVKEIDLQKREEIVLKEEVAPLPLPTKSAKAIFTARATDFPRSDCPWTDLPVFENNRTQFVIAQKGDTYRKIADAVQRSEKEMRKFNDAEKSAELVENQVVYIEHKSKKSELNHVVQEGETLRYIAQKYAVQLSMIYHYNNLSETSIIHPGDIIKLNN